MLITRLHLVVTPLLCITITYAITDLGQTIEDFPVDLNMTFDHRPEACKIMVFDPKTNIICSYSDKAKDLCDLTEQSPSCRNSKNSAATVPTDKCQLLLIKIPENDLGSYNISSPDGPSTNGKNVQITVSNPSNSPKTPTLVTAGAGFMVLSAVIGFIMASKTNDLVTVEVAEAEVQRSPESEQHSLP